MKKLTCLALFSLLGFSAYSQLWFEDFADEPNGAVVSSAVAGTLAGPRTWSVTTNPSGGAASFAKQTYATQDPGNGCAPDVNYEAFILNQTGTEGVWTSNVINITGLGTVALEVLLAAAFTNPGDYIRAYYILDGQPPVLFGELLGGAAVNFAFPSSAIISGTSVQIVIRGMETLAGNFACTMPRVMGFDDVTLTDILTIFSRANTNWNVGTTWSLVAPGGVSCGCTPNNTTEVVVAGNTVTIPTALGAADVVSLEVRAASTVTIQNNIEFNFHRGGTLNILNGGTVSSGAFTTSQINFDVANTFPITVAAGGTLIIGDIDINAGATLNISGGGTISVVDDIEIASTATINNSISNSFTVGSQIIFEAGADANLNNNGVLTTNSVVFSTDNSNITNNGTLTFTAGITVSAGGDDDNVIVNSAGATLTTGTINLSDADFDLLNSGTINQTGNFNNINNADTNFDNLATGIWNWTSASIADPEMSNVLDCTATGNRFNYSAAGAQRVINTATYHHINLSNSGTKTMIAAVAVNGDLSIGGTSILDPGNFTITLRGNWTNSSTNADPFAQGTGLVDFRGTAAQTISNTGDAQGTEFFNVRFFNTFGTSPQLIIGSGNMAALGTLTCTQGNVNLNGVTFTIGINAGAPGTLVHGGTSASGWMYGGTLRRFFNTGTIANGSVTGLFPMGENTTDFRPFSLSCPTTGITTGGSFSLSVSGGTSTTVVSIADASPPPVTIIRQYQGAWSITNTAIVGGTYNIVAGGTGFGTIIALAHLRLHKVASALGTHVLATGTTTDPRLQRQGLTLAQLTTTGGAQWFVGSSDASSSLPIVLTYFKAKPEGDYVKTEWATAQEINNDFFTVQKTTDLETFYDLEKIPGQGNSREQHSYSLIDKSPFAGRSYYRLKQTDFDGKYTYSNLVTVDYEGQAYLSLQAYPNPSEGKQITIELKGLQKTETVPVQIYNQQGLKMYDMMLYGDGTGVVSQEVIFNSGLPQGLYIIKAGKTLQLTRKIVVN